MLLRFHRDGMAQVQRALTMCAKHIDADSGRIIGIARSYNVGTLRKTFNVLIMLYELDVSKSFRGLYKPRKNVSLIG